MLARASECLIDLREAVVVPGVGHCLLWEDPEGMNRRIVDALSG